MFQRDKKHLEESLAEVKEQEEEMSRANRALSTRLDDVQVGSRTALGGDAWSHRNGSSAFGLGDGRGNSAGVKAFRERPCAFRTFVVKNKKDTNYFMSF